MTEQEIKRLAEGAPPEEYEPAMIWLAKEVLRLRRELMNAYMPEGRSDHDL